MADLGFAAELDPTQAAELASILARRQAAQQRANRFAGGMLGHFGAKDVNVADAQVQELAARHTSAQNAAVQNYMAQRFGSPEIPSPADELGGGPGKPAVKADPQRAVTEAMLSRHPRLQALGAAELGHQLKQQDPYTLNEGDRRVIPQPGGADKTVDNPKLPTHQIPADWEKSLPAGANREPNDPPGVFRMKGTDGQMDVYSVEFDRGAAKGYKKLDASQITRITNNNPAPVTTAEIIDPKDPTRMLKIDARVYKAGGSLGDPGVLGVSGKLSDTQKLDTKRQFNMQGIGATLQEAQDLLEAEEKPTGSGVGAVVDAAAAIVGKSPRGAVPAQKLKAVGGALTSKVPRMEGPQSDHDVRLYKEMAAEVGNNTIPVDRRLAALETMRKLWLKYEKLNADAFLPLGNIPEQAPAGAVRRK